MDYCNWDPFLKAALERNPVSVAFFREEELPGVYRRLLSWPGESIYEGNRLALPDEVVNFGRGDGIEKAIVLANVIRSRDHGAGIILDIQVDRVLLHTPGGKFSFTSVKNFTKKLLL